MTVPAAIAAAFVAVLSILTAAGIVFVLGTGIYHAVSTILDRRNDL